MSIIESKSRIVVPDINPRSGYQTLDIREGFDWEGFYEHVPYAQAELVVFRSTRCVGTDKDLLTRYDDAAHEEALGSEGLIYYFKGEEIPETRQNLSFCLWENEKALKEAAQKTKHKDAVGMAFSFYKNFELERYALTKIDDTPKVLFEAKSPHPKW
jgi:hypothetical protein